MRVADEGNSVECQQPRVEERLDAGALCRRIDTRIEQCSFHRLLVEVPSMEKGQELFLIANRQIIRGESAQRTAAGLDPKTSSVQARRGVAFAEDRKRTILAPQIVRKLQ